MRLAVACALAGAAAAQSLQFPPGVDRVAVKMRLLRNGDYGPLPVVELGIGEETGWFIADTGAGTVLANPDLLARMGIAGKGKIRMLGAGATTSTKVYALPPLRLGTLRLSGVKAIASDLGRLGKRLGQPLLGLLGNAVFAGHVVTFDYERRELVVHRGAKFQAPEGATQVLVELTFGIPSIRASVGGHRPGRFLLDTGNQLPVMLNAPWVARRELLAEPERFPRINVGGIGGKQPLRLAIVSELRLGRAGALVVRDVPVGMADKKAGGLLGDAVRAGNIGAPVLERFRFTLDFERRVAWFEPRGDVGAGLQRWFGFVLYVRQRSPQIQLVVPQSPAAAAGLKRFDELVSIDGEAVAGLAIREIAEKLRGLEAARLVFERHRRAEPLRVQVVRTKFLPSFPGPRTPK